MFHFTDIDKLTHKEIEALLDRSESFKRQRYQNLLSGKTLVAMFFNPSTRTRISFDLAMKQLGGHCIAIDPNNKGSWGIEIEEGAIMDGDAEEHLKDATRVIARYADAIAVRAFPKFVDWSIDREDRVIQNMVKWSNKPVINMETITHPCQALAMAKTMRDKIGDLRGKKFTLTWVYHPRPLNTAVANSAGMMAAMLGMDVVLAHPQGYNLDPRYTDVMKRECASAGRTFSIENNMDKAMEGADFVYCKSWGSLQTYGNFNQASHDLNRGWIVNAERMAKTNNAYFSHCLPVRRNVKVTDEVIDSPQSVVIDEAENRLHVQKAVLCAALEG